MSIDSLFGPGPNGPRPTHPDFTRLVSAVLKIDGKTEDASFDMEAFLSEAVDPESVLYMANQRALRLCEQLQFPGSFAAVLSALWLDGFVVGGEYRSESNPKGEQ